jgi:hypothetical protein
MYNISTVTFCTAFHYGNFGRNMYTDDKHNNNIQKLTELFTKIINAFNKSNIIINIKSSKNIDEDFIYMVKSHYFEKDFLGFSNLINDIRNS